MGKQSKPELRASEVIRDEKGRIPKGVSGNPGGQSKEKRAFLDRLTTDDADEVYEALMDLVRERNPMAVLRAVEYIARKPPNAAEDNEALEKAGGAWPLTREETLEIARRGK